MTENNTSEGMISLTDVAKKIADLEQAIAQLNTAITTLSSQVTKLETDIENCATTDELATVSTDMQNNASAITMLSSQVAELKTDTEYINNLKGLLDVNIKLLKKHDVLQYDGSKWTNVDPKTFMIEQENGVKVLNNLSDVIIDETHLSNKQVLTWNGDYWTNKSVESVENFNEDTMWDLLKSNTNEKINPSHINDQDLNLNSIATTQGANLTYGEVKLIVNAGNVTTIGNFTATKEVSAHSSL